MKRIELVQFNRELLQKLQQAGVKMDDWQYVEMVSDYRRMVAEGHKRTYAVTVVAERYGISTRTAYTILQRLCQDCTSLAPE